MHSQCSALGAQSPWLIASISAEAHVCPQVSDWTGRAGICCHCVCGCRGDRVICCCRGDEVTSGFRDDGLPVLYKVMRELEVVGVIRATCYCRGDGVTCIVRVMESPVIVGLMGPPVLLGCGDVFL